MFYARAAKKIMSSAAPVIGKLGGMIGGKVGRGLQRIGSAAGGINCLLGSDSEDSTNETGSSLLGSGGAGIRRIIPGFK